VTDEKTPGKNIDYGDRFTIQQKPMQLNSAKYLKFKGSLDFKVICLTGQTRSEACHNYPEDHQ